jgi:hypothetical protein
MNLPDVSHPRWAEIICGTAEVDFKFLVLKLMVSRLRVTVSSRPETLPQAVEELHRFFVKNGHTTWIQAELRAIFQEGIRRLLSVEETVALIQAGKPLLLAGDGDLLASLPRGRWIGGSIPYFVTPQGGCCIRDRIFVDDLTGLVHENARITVYRGPDISRIYTDARPDHVRFVIMPAASPTHLAFALGAPSFPNFASVPLIGWVSGVHLKEIGKRAPTVFDGSGTEGLQDAAVVLEMALPSGSSGNIRIVNPFSVDLSSPVIQFEQTGFSAQTALVNGERLDFSAFLKNNSHDGRFPLVGNYCGAGINVSIQSVHETKVDFYAPVFEGVQYRLARPLLDYRGMMQSQLEGHWSGTCFNCILNYLYGKLEGHVVGSAAYPCTFGEIGYQLMNQTFVHLDIVGHGQTI